MSNDSPTGRRFVRWLPAVVVMAVIFILSSRTGDELDTVLPWVQKLFPWLESFDPGHYAAYFVLALSYAFGFGFRRMNVGRSLLVVLMSLLYGVTDEWHQSFVPNRTPDLADLLHDGIGAAVAVVCVAIWNGWERGRSARKRK
ncbi:VanZ family protein [Cohnella massiliensis]|uniref:VanZ family protein n=1 Tax=Cohnella massiliensis TaxID=1816691 RepID=UPI0009BB7FB5|nr:VanZ family protein [Cohnella massiliensis]